MINSASAMTWPTDPEWKPVLRNDIPLGDILNDAPKERDITGNASNPCCYYFNNSKDIFFRMRLDESPEKKQGGLKPFGWGIDIDSNNNIDDYEYLVMINGITKTESVNVYKNERPSPVGFPGVPSTLIRSYFPAEEYVKVQEAGSNSNNDPDYFISWYIPLEYLINITGINGSSNINVIFGTSNNAHTLASDIVDGASISLALDQPPGTIVYTNGSLNFMDQNYYEKINTTTAGNSIYFRVIDYDQDLDKLTKQTMELTLRSSNGDAINILLTETNNSSGIFTGSIKTNEAALNTSDETLQVISGGNITATYDDRNYLGTRVMLISLIDVIDLTAPYWDPSPSDQIIYEGSSFEYTVHATDTGVPIIYGINENADFSIDENGSIVNLTILKVGVNGLNLTATDKYGNTNYSSITIIVRENNHFTMDTDFDKGELIGLEHNTLKDQIQLSKISTAFPFIWVPNSGEGTISKVDTVTGDESGRYRVAPASLPGGGNPSRTTVDLYGNVWVANRQAGTVVKVGLYEAGQCIDRNGNGTIDSSLDLDHDGNITGNELLPWGQDECVLYEVVLIPEKQGVYTPGTYSEGYDTDYWGVAPRGMAIDASNDLWAGTWNTSKYYHIDGANGRIIQTLDVSPWGHNAYGAIIDRNGILWSAKVNDHVLRINISDFSDIRKINISTTYGIGLDLIGNLYVGGSKKIVKVDVNNVDNPIQWTKSAYVLRGVTTTSDNNIWVAGHSFNTISRHDSNGKNLAIIKGFNNPTGVAVDAAGKVWAADLGSEYIRRIDPSTNKIDLEKKIIGGGGHYTYSDMTGYIVRGITTNIGTWNKKYDSGASNTSWGRVLWNSSIPAGGSIEVRIRTSETIEGLQVAAYRSVMNGSDFYSKGRYLQIETRLKANSARESPVIYDLTVEPADSKIMGIVSNNGTGIEGAIITTNSSFSTTTDYSGSYSLMVLAGSYELTVTKTPEYYPNSSVVVDSISIMTRILDFEFEKKKTGTINGKVRSSRYLKSVSR